MKLPVVARWVLLPIASMGACSGTVVFANAIGTSIARVIPPERGYAIEASVPVDVRTGIVYAIAATAFVIAGAQVAPRYRVAVGMLLYGVGSFIAWWELNDWYIPEGYPRAYQSSHVPLTLTLVGGLASVLMILALRLHNASSRVRSRPAS